MNSVAVLCPSGHASENEVKIAKAMGIGHCRRQSCRPRERRLGLETEILRCCSGLEALISAVFETDQ